MLPCPPMTQGGICLSQALHRGSRMVPGVRDVLAALPTKGRGEGAGGRSSAAEGKSAELRVRGFLWGTWAGLGRADRRKGGGGQELSSPSPKQKLVATEPSRGCAVTRAGHPLTFAPGKCILNTSKGLPGALPESPCSLRRAGATTNVPESFLPWERLQPERLWRGAGFP